jgi:hypothetical protein
MHRMADFEPPTNSEAIKAVLAGIRRSIGTAVTRKAPATAETIRIIVVACRQTFAGFAIGLCCFLGSRARFAALS